MPRDYLHSNSFFNWPQIIEEGALEDFVQMLHFTDLREQANTAECLWTLTFDKTVRQTIIDFPDLVPALEELKNSENPLVKNNVQGALWMIRGENDPTASVARMLHIYYSHLFYKLYFCNYGICFES